MCCSGADWKREEVPDHKFDFIDVSEFRITGAFTRMRYAWVYILVLKSFLVYVADAYTAIAMLASNHWSGSIIANAGDSKAVKVPFSIGKWIFCGCIIFSFLLLAWEARKARAIIRSRDISYAFTNIMANNYYSMKSYNHFCFFCQINNSKKKKDEFAFFVFFTFKGWKRLLLADAPRQVINGLTLYSFGKAVNFTTNLSAYYDGSLVKAGILVTMIFTVVVWVGSAILLLIAAILYIPLLCYIQGNLKEYCCHKIDKRIAELMKRKARKRLAQEAALARKEAAGDFSHLKDKKGNLLAKPMAQPTLPDIDLDDEDGYYAKSEVSYNNAYYPPPNPYIQNPLQSQPWSNQPRYQLSDTPAPQPPYYPQEGYEPSIASVDKLSGVEREQKLQTQYQHGAESSHSLVDMKDPSSYSLNKAPSYHSEESYHRRHPPTSSDVVAAPLPRHSVTNSDLYAYENSNYIPHDNNYHSQENNINPHFQYQGSYYGSEAGELPSQATSHNNREEGIIKQSIPVPQDQVRPESTWDIDRYYNNDQQFEINDEHMHQWHAR